MAGDASSRPAISNVHAQEAATVAAVFGSSADGLSDELAAERLSNFGPNRPRAAPKPGIARRFLSHFNNILIYVLLGAAAITSVLGHLVDTVVILAVVIVNAVIGLVQEGRAEQAMAKIQQMLAPHAAVIRNGRRLEISSEELVLGDLVLLEAGDRIPADLRLVEAYGLQAQEAVLTGESLPVEKNPASAAIDAPLGDRSSLAFSGTLVTAGQGRGIVVATAEETEIGRISGMLADVVTLTTPLVEQMNGFARWLTLLILLIAVGLFVFGYYVVNLNFSEIFMAIVGLSVSAIPEGLPAVLTITLAIGVQTMARRNAIVRRLPAIETLGSVSVICTDKTGTLTRNEMMVASAALADQTFSIGGEGYRPEGEISSEHASDDAIYSETLSELALVAALCNDAELRDTGETWTVSGDPMEGALQAFAIKAGRPLESLTREWLRSDTIPFDARYRFMATLQHRRDGPGLITVKGAPEQVLSMCLSQRSVTGGALALDADHWRMRIDELSAMGQRVLAFATRVAMPDERKLPSAELLDDLVLLGLVGLIDPPRPAAVAAITACQAAGIRVKMITGDHAGTAAAIGKQVGLKNPKAVLTGADLDALTAAELTAAVLDTDIFARTNPGHKLRLVEALQSHGLTVAMTGDGVNDAPALKRADAGIAMGRSGSEAAKEAADIVLADDDFASIAAAVREGRTVYDNIKKVISWTLPTNGGEALTIVITILFGLTLPITPIQILWINLVTATTLGIALAFEPTEEDTMLRPPRPRAEPILSGTLAWQIILASLLISAGVFGVFSYAVGQGYELELARTLALNSLVIMEIFYLFYVRNIYGPSLTWTAVRGTKAVWLTVIVVIAAQLAITYAPPFQAIFATRSVSFLDGVLLFAIGIAFFVALELEKRLRLSLAAMGQTVQRK
jgi:magnesium-transporting ATPase (P-type)